MQLLATGPNCQQTSSTTSTSSAVAVENVDSGFQCVSHPTQASAYVSWHLDVPHVRQEFNCCGVPVQLSTITIGANPSYAKEWFYAENMAEDEARVARLFRMAPDKGISIKQRSIPLEEIQRFLLSGEHVIVALVDKAKLNAAASSLTNVSPIISSSLVASTASYTGHYITICGYDSIQDAFDIRDPASEHKKIKLPSVVLDLARKSYGTDEDLLIIQLPSRITAMQR